MQHRAASCKRDGVVGADRAKLCTPLLIVAIAANGAGIRNAGQDSSLGTWTFVAEGLSCDEYTLAVRKGERCHLHKELDTYPLSLYEFRNNFATRLSAGCVADHMVTQMLRQGDSEVFKLYSQAKLGMMREALAKLDREANERKSNFRTEHLN